MTIAELQEALGTQWVVEFAGAAAGRSKLLHPWVTTIAPAAGTKWDRERIRIRGRGPSLDAAMHEALAHLAQFLVERTDVP